MSSFTPRGFFGLLFGVLSLCGGMMPGTARAYVFEGPRWPSNATIVMNLELGATKLALNDRFATWDDSAADALKLWNQYLDDGVEFQAVSGSTAAVGRGNGVNTVEFAANVYGRAFGSDVLAVTVLSHTADDMTFVESDTVFNSARKWDSYRGPLLQDAATGRTLVDFHRVAIHEFGHTLGLDHPDEHGQYRNAVMNSRISDVDMMTSDDISGVSELYRNVGRLVKTFDLKAGQLLADPVRPRLYATLPQDNALAVIDTDTLAVVANLSIGSNPADLSLSPDGHRLYVANSGSTLAGVGVVDLDTLNVLPSLALPVAPGAIAAGTGDRLYLLENGSNGPSKGIIQVDAMTGSLQNTFGRGVANYQGFLQISPDRRTLYYGNKGLSPSTLARFDVSTATGTLLQQNRFGDLGGNGGGLTLGHDGRFLCFPNGSGNASNYVTSLIPANDVDGIIGTFNTGAYPGRTAFSPDDRLVYEAGNAGVGIQVFSTETFTLVGSFLLTNQAGGSSSDINDVSSMAATNGVAGYLFVATSFNSYESSPGSLRVFRAASNPPRPARQIPVVSVMGAGAARGGFVVSRADVPLDVDLTIAYHHGGGAIQDEDYVAFPGSVTIPAGEAEAIIPVNLLPAANRNRKVKVFLDPSPTGDYTIGKAQSKVFLSDL